MQMKAQLAQFGTDNKDVGIIKINIDEVEGEAWKKYGELWPESGIPYSVIVDKEGKKLGEFGGFHSAEDIKVEVDASK